MRVKFNQAVHLAGKDYPRGTHDVPDEAINHKFFLKLAEQGLVEDGESQPVQHQNLVHRQKALHDKIAGLQAKTAGNKAALRDVNAPLDVSRTAEVNPVTGKAQMAAPGGAGVAENPNPAPAYPPAGTGEGAAPGQPPTSAAGLADGNPPDGSPGTSGATGNAVGGAMPPADAIPGEGFGPKDDGEASAEEESGPDSRDDQPHRHSKKSRR
jgi:hypothetical protein